MQGSFATAGAAGREHCSAAGFVHAQVHAVSRVRIRRPGWLFMVIIAANLLAGSKHPI